MVLDHVAQRAGFLVVGAARLDADALADRDLHVVDVIPVPQGLEDAIGPAEDEDVLDGLLPEVVVDPVDLILAPRRCHHLVERPRRGQIAPERLLDDDAHPALAALRRAVQPRLAEPRDQVRVERRGRRHVEEPVAARAALALDVAHVGVQAGVDRGVGGVAGIVEEGLREAVPHPGRRRLDAGEVGDGLAHEDAEPVVVHLGAPDADHREGLGEDAPLEHRPQGGHELPARQVAGGAEDHEDAGLIRRRACHRETFPLRAAASPCARSARAPAGPARPSRRGGGG